MLLSSNIPSGNFIFVVFTSEVTDFIQSVACSLVLSPWASVALSPRGKFMSLLGEGGFHFCDMSQTFFGVSAISSKKSVLVTSTYLRDVADVERLVMLLSNVSFFWLASGFAFNTIAVSV